MNSPLPILLGLTLILLLHPTPTPAWPTGAGSCNTGGPAVGGTHSRSEVMGSVQESFTVAVNGTLWEEAQSENGMDFVMGETYNFQITAPSPNLHFKGYAIILGQTSSNQQAGEFIITTGQPIATGCPDTVQSVTHTNNTLKESTQVQIQLYDSIPHNERIRLDVTLVLQNNAQSIFYYSGFYLQDSQPSNNSLISQNITVQFNVSNLNNITDAAQVNASGIAQSWPLLAQQVVANVTREQAQGAFQTVTLQPNSSLIESIQQIPCDSTTNHPNATCHQVMASYTLVLLREEVEKDVELLYRTYTLIAIQNGNYQTLLQSELPESPIRIGSIPTTESMPTQDNGSSILDVVSSSPDHTLLAEAMNRSNVNLDRDNFTLFAPTDRAVENWGGLGKLLQEEWTYHLADFVLYHAVAGLWTRDDLLQNRPASYTSANNETVNVTVKDGSIVLNDQATVSMEIDEPNGTMHVIDAVLLPASVLTNGMEFVSSTPYLSTLASLLRLARLDQDLSEEGPFTLWAPHNDAFANMSKEEMDYIIAEGNRDVLMDVLTYHVALGIHTTAGLRSQSSIDFTMVNAKNVSLQSFPYTIESSRLVKNGVVHVIDTVLLPKVEVTVVPNSTDNNTECPIGDPDVVCNTEFDPVLCPMNCTYSNPCVASAAGFEGCVPAVANATERDPALLDDATECPSPEMGVCTMEVDPVECGVLSCIYENDCLANAAGWEGCTSVDTASQTVWQIINSTADVGRFRASLEAVNIDKLLVDGSSLFTVFAPLNEAVELSLDVQFYNDNVNTWSGHLTSLLENHIIDSGSYLQSELFDGAVGPQTSLAGEQLAIDTTAGLVGGHSLSDPDLFGSNGVVHIIDGILMNEWHSLSMVQLLENGLASSTIQRRKLQTDAFVRLLEVLRSTQLINDSVLNERSVDGATLVAPTDISIDGQVSGQTTTEDLLSYHILETNLYSQSLDRGSQRLLSTRHPSAAQVWVTVDEGGVMRFNDVISQQEILGQNGVLHVVDEALIPPSVADLMQYTSIYTNRSIGIVSGLVQASGWAANESMFVGTSQDQGVTLLAPIDEFWETINQEDQTRLKLQSWSLHLQDLLRHMILPEAYSKEGLGATAETPSLAGTTVALGSIGIRGPTMQATNGVIHTVNNINLPESITSSILDLIEGNAAMANLLTLINTANLAETLNSQSPVTFFAPSAWSESISSSSLRETLENHIFLDILYADQLAKLDGQVITSMNNKEWIVEVLGGSVFLKTDKGDARVQPVIIRAPYDILGRNGLFHNIDGPLLDESPASESPSVPPTGFSQPTVAPTTVSGISGNETLVRINATFLMFNTEGLTSLDIAEQETAVVLYTAFLDFVENLVADVEGQETQRHLSSRRLDAALQPNSVTIYGVQGLECPTDEQPPIPDDALCHNVYGRYEIAVSDESPAAVEERYVTETEKALEEGKLQESLEKTDPDSLFVVQGAAPKNETSSPTVLPSNSTAPTPLSFNETSTPSSNGTAVPSQAQVPSNQTSIPSTNSTVTMMPSSNYTVPTQPPTYGPPTPEPTTKPPIRPPETRPPETLLPTFPVNQTVAPTVATPQPTFSPTGMPTLIRVNTTFLMYNTEGLLTSEDVSKPSNVVTLNRAFNVFVVNLVADVEGNRTRRGRYLRANRFVRRLEVALQPRTTAVYGVRDLVCPTNLDPPLPENASCQNVYGKYNLSVVDEDPDVVHERYVNATEKALEDGKVQQSLNAIDPDYPFVVYGPAVTDESPPPKPTDAPAEESKSMEWWLILIIVLSCVLGLCCIGSVIAYSCRGSKKSTDEDAESAAKLMEEDDPTSRPPEPPCAIAPDNVLEKSTESDDEDDLEDDHDTDFEEDRDMERMEQQSTVFVEADELESDEDSEPEWEDDDDDEEDVPPSPLYPVSCVADEDEDYGIENLDARSYWDDADSRKSDWLGDDATALLEESVADADDFVSDDEDGTENVDDSGDENFDEQAPAHDPPVGSQYGDAPAGEDPSNTVGLPDWQDEHDDSDEEEARADRSLDAASLPDPSDAAMGRLSSVDAPAAAAASSVASMETSTSEDREGWDDEDDEDTDDEPSQLATTTTTEPKRGFLESSDDGSGLEGGGQWEDEDDGSDEGIVDTENQASWMVRDKSFSTIARKQGGE